MDRLLAKLSTDQRTVLDNLLLNLQHNILGFSQVNIKYYVDHGAKHCEGVVGQLCDMISDEVRNTMNSDEIFILLCSAWLHDIGLLMNADEHGRQLQDHEIRDRHHELSRWLIISKHEILGLTDSNFAGIVAEVAYCHRRQVDIRTHFPCDTELLGNSKIRVRFLAALLRLADAMDLGRAPHIITEHLWKLDQNEKKQALSLRKWRACQLVKGIEYVRIDLQ